MEYVPGGELYNLIERKGRLSEDEARVYTQQILSALEYCHRRKVAHRDIKPENIFLDEEKNIKLGDFGLSNLMQAGEFLRTSCGSPNYAAPEVISGCMYCGTEVDVWSTGVVLYALLAGYLPFDDNNTTSLFAKIKTANYIMPHHFSPEVKDLISRMLTVDPVARITINQIKAHPWYNVDVPVAIQFKESLPLLSSDTVACLSSIKANTESTHEIDEEIFAKCLAIPEFANIVHDQETLRRKILDHRNETFTVCYELLLDHKLKQLRKEMKECTNLPSPTFLRNSLLTTNPKTEKEPSSHIAYEKMTQSTSSSSEAELPFIHAASKYVHPRNWVYGFRYPVAPEILMMKLHEYFRENGYEWKYLNNFQLRVRTVNWRKAVLPLLIKSLKIKPVEYGHHIKMDINLFRYDDTYVIDCRLMEGQLMVYMEFCAEFYRFLDAGFNKD